MDKFMHFVEDKMSPIADKLGNKDIYLQCKKVL